MTDKLPPNLLALFAPRPALRWVPPSDHALEQRHTSNVGGVGQFLPALQQYKEDDHYEPTESWLQRRDRIKQEKLEAIRKLQTEDVKDYKPSEDPQVKGDPFKTLFVSRLSYETEVKDLEREFGRFGPIERIRLVSDTHANDIAPKQKKLRGYAFVVFERERDMKAAYKESDGVRIRDRRVLVDVERGRTVSGWRPMRFGGGLGGRGYTKTMPSKPVGLGAGGFGPPPGPGGFRGGFRGGFGGRGGGFRGGPPRGGGFGGRGGIGYQSNGYGSGPPPEGAPSGPRGGRGGAGYGGGYSSGRPFEDRRGGYEDRSGSGSNAEPVRPRERGGGGGGYRDRDRDGGYGGQDDYSRKREYSGDDYDERRSRRRY